MGFWWVAKVIINKFIIMSIKLIGNRIWTPSSWLLRDPEMKVRTSYPGFIEVADSYLTEVFRRVVNLQFQKGDGPIIAIQVPVICFIEC